MFKNIFSGKQSPQTATYFKTLNDFTPFFSAFNGSLYDSDIVRTCIDAIARHAGKLKPKHIRRVNGEILQTSSDLEWMLQVRPNRYMNGYDFIYKTVSQLYSNNNAFIYIHTVNGGIEGFYPLNFSTVELLEYQDELYCRFLFNCGFRMTVPYTDLIHLRRHYNRDDIFGEDGRRPLKPTLDLINTINQGISNAIKSSARIRGWLQFNASMRPEDIRAQRDQFVEEYFSINNDGGIAATDSKGTFTPTNLEPKLADDKQMTLTRENAYRYFGVNDKIIQGNYTEDEFNAFYSAVLEPIAIQLSLEFTAKTFTDRELGHGNEIVFSANRLTFASNNTKVQMARYILPFGILTINEMREIFELEPVKDGDKRLITLNVVDASKQNQYQVGDDLNGESQTGDPDGGDSNSGNT
jgi:phage portal protein, HK97 family